MKKIILFLTIGLTISLFASENFEDKHLKCTLVKKDGEIISERQAESLDEFKKDVLVSKINLEIASGHFRRDTFKYSDTDKDGNDIYTYLDKKVSITPSNQLYIIEIKENLSFMEYPPYVNSTEKMIIDKMNEGRQQFYTESKNYSCNEVTLDKKSKSKISK